MGSEMCIRDSVKEAEMHAEEDKRKRELAEVRNMADSLIYSTEKSLKEVEDKLDEEDELVARIPCLFYKFFRT